MVKKINPWIRYIIILAFAVLLLLLVTLKNKKHGSKVADVFQVKTEEITAFTIGKGQNSVTLIKADTTWIFAEPDTGAVKDWRINNFFTNIVNAKRTGFVTKNPEKYDQYNISDSLAIYVQLKHGESVLETVFVGRSKSSYSQDYVRYPDDPKVYITQKKLLSYLGEKAASWR